MEYAVNRKLENTYNEKKEEMTHRLGSAAGAHTHSLLSSS